MTNTKLYSPPNRDFPQGLPDYWKFDDGTVRTDMKQLGTRIINELGWSGPYEYPVPKNKEDETQTFDYDPDTQKFIWDRIELKFHIVDMDEDEINYLETLRTPSSPPKTQTAEPNWELFEKVVLRNRYIIQMVESASLKNPLVASAFPASFYMTKLGSFSSFKIIWKEVMRAIEVYPSVVQDTIRLAMMCNIPQEFIDIISDYIPDAE
jgi:hypothetical protein